MNLLYCGDRGIKDGLLISILSFLQHSSEPLHIYVLTIDYETTKPLSVEYIDFLDKYVKSKKPQHFVKRIDASAIFSQNPPEKNMKTYFTPASMLRLYIDKIPELPDKILYLDYDVLCRKDPKDLWKTDIENYEAAGVLDIYGKNFYHYNFPKTDYMNSGVMLFNLPECRKNGVFEKAVDLCKNHWMLLADQSALNRVIKKRLLLPRKFNEQQDHPKKDTVLHHFSNNFKFFPYFHVQKVKPQDVSRVHSVLHLTEYDDLFAGYESLKPKIAKL